MLRSPQLCHPDQSRSPQSMICGVEGPTVETSRGREGRWRSSRNRRRESTKERQEDSVHLVELPTQAKTRLEWATRPNACFGSTSFQIGASYQPTIKEGSNLVSVGPLLVATTNQFFDQYSATSSVS